MNHCGKQLVPKIAVFALSKEELGTCETQWIPHRTANGFLIISNDRQMINAHDIAALAQRCGATIFLLRRDVSQQRRWQLLKWFANNMPQLALNAQAIEPGTTWLVSRKCEIVRVEPSQPVESES